MREITAASIGLAFGLLVLVCLRITSPEAVLEPRRDALPDRPGGVRGASRQGGISVLLDPS